MTSCVYLCRAAVASYVLSTTAEFEQKINKFFLAVVMHRGCTIARIHDSDIGTPGMDTSFSIPEEELSRNEVCVISSHSFLSFFQLFLKIIHPFKQNKQPTTYLHYHHAESCTTGDGAGHAARPRPGRRPRLLLVAWRENCMLNTNHSVVTNDSEDRKMLLLSFLHRTLSTRALSSVVSSLNALTHRDFFNLLPRACRVACCCLYVYCARRRLVRPDPALSDGGRSMPDSPGLSYIRIFPLQLLSSPLIQGQPSVLPAGQRPGHLAERVLAEAEGRWCGCALPVACLDALVQIGPLCSLCSATCRCPTPRRPTTCSSRSSPVINHLISSLMWRRKYARSTAAGAVAGATRR